ncbi:hypothetical protein L1987_67071 [Smallanthus sonchifolius]|uniref:Uncharacterized protein n=1 Tax=Smallanthus sonchifolius TaxID=185202 RepID=A0ACB9BZ07_9ASTR|nr:hypothetical protein L1987_67071 [Smallanthus sonchifolius]
MLAEWHATLFTIGISESIRADHHCTTTTNQPRRCTVVLNQPRRCESDSRPGTKFGEILEDVRNILFSRHINPALLSAKIGEI